jgi:CBS domain-containing protein
MRVKDIMTVDPAVCSPDTTLAAAAHLMWDADCGFLPVVQDGKLLGVATDRDMFIALATRNRLASSLTVGEVATTAEVWSCEPDDDVHAALDMMKTHRVRRLPVVGFGNSVLGIVSMNDLLLAAGPKKAVRSDEVVDTLQSICAHHHPLPRIVAA